MNISDGTEPSGEDSTEKNDECDNPIQIRHWVRLVLIDRMSP